ncbi:MAG: glycoside hydrolase domain-containing protein [Nocardioides sp.]
MSRTPRPSFVRRTTTAVVALAVTLAGTVAAGLVLRPAEAATKVMPGSFTGFAFDTYTAPPQAAMDAWWQSSPYWGVGIYTSGTNRFDEVQAELTPTWVSTQASRGWRLLPIHVGLQASCSDPGRSWERIDPNPTDTYATARAQGSAQADEAVASATALGIGSGTTIWYDLEHFDVNDVGCRDSALALVSGWTERLHARGFRSGFYSSASSGITMLENARADAGDSWSLPDQIWIAHYVSRTEPCDLDWGTTSTSFIPDEGWQRNRARQFCGSHTETYGGVPLSIDSNYLDLGKGADPKGRAKQCGVQVDFPRYPALHRRDRGPKVAALQCFLRKKHAYGGRIDEKFDAGMTRAVKRFQRRSESLPVTGRVNKKTWVALLSAGSEPLLKRGSRDNAVRRLQRALNAAVGKRLDVTGVVDRRTEKAISRYQRGRGLPRTGVVTAVMWEQLGQGRR